MMEFIENILSQSWFNSLIGILGLVVAYFFYRASKIGGRPLYTMHSLKLLGEGEHELPSDVTILFKGKKVPRLAKLSLAFWNSGNKTIKGKDIVGEDGIKVIFDDDKAEILDANVIRKTRDANKFDVKIAQNPSNVAICSFDYLDAGDGATVEILHTSSNLKPKIDGTIRGVPKGIGKYKGYIRDSKIKKMRFMALVGLIELGVLLFLLYSGSYWRLSSYEVIFTVFTILVLLCITIILLYKLYIDKKRPPRILCR